MKRVYLYSVRKFVLSITLKITFLNVFSNFGSYLVFAPFQMFWGKLEPKVVRVAFLEMNALQS